MKFKLTTNRLLLAVLALLGLFPVRNHFGKLNQLKFSYRNIFFPISVLWLLQPTILVSDIIINKSLLQTLQVKELSKKITYYATVTSIYISNNIIRLAAIFYCQDTVKLVQILNEDFGLPKSIRGVFKSRRGLKIGVKLLCFVLTGAAATGFFLITRSMEIYSDFEIPDERLQGLKTVPNIPVVGRLFIFMADLLILTALAFAFIFILVFGCILVQVQHHVCLILLQEFEKLDTTVVTQSDTVLAPVDFVYKRFDNDILHCPDIPRLLESMKNLFELYGVIGGWYAIGVIFFALTEIINNTSGFAFDDFKLSTSITLFIEGVALILFLATFGEFLQVEIEKSIEVIADAMGTTKCKNDNQSQKLLIWSEWFLQWKWCPNARHLFEVNHTLIPAVIGTVLTYFIFMFQLRISEIEGMKTYNSTTIQACLT
ncbi:unnamed protein product [Allacma fusca]|uniref:Uncharacterized protein n=1 Tax=Allacma fusca TaxID=39272 RepID=A0A8J2PT52_9HEXA|nr:unnamed protein product [Allacma fusca]